MRLPRGKCMLPLVIQVPSPTLRAIPPGSRRKWQANDPRRTMALLCMLQVAGKTMAWKKWDE